MGGGVGWGNSVRFDFNYMVSSIASPHMCHATLLDALLRFHTCVASLLAILLHIHTYVTLGCWTASLHFHT